MAGDELCRDGADPMGFATRRTWPLRRPIASTLAAGAALLACATLVRTTLPSSPAAAKGIVASTGPKVGGLVELQGFGGGRSITVVQSALDTGDRLSWKPELLVKPDFTFDGPVVNVDVSKVDQEIVGFGGAFTEAAAVTFNKLPPLQQDIFIEDYFGASGLGYTMGRVHINSCDFSAKSYTFDDVQDDFSLAHFDYNLTHDKKALIPLIQRAKRKIEETVTDTRVRASASAAGRWEQLKAFEGINGPGTLALRSAAHKFLSTEADGSVKANNLKAVTSTFFKMVENPDGTVSLQGAYGKYVVASQEGFVRADAGTVVGGARFKKVNNPDGTISLKSHTGKFLSTEPTQQLRLLASPWSPPAWMKTSGKMDGSGQPCLRGEAQASWAAYISKWISSYGKTGLPIWGLTVQNEPSNNAGWEACTLTPQEEASFLGSHLGPKVKAEHPEVAIFVFDDSKHMLPDYVDVAMAKPEIAQYVQGAAFHWYSGDFFDKVSWVHQKHPEIMLLPSEATYERRMWKKGMVETYSDWRFGEGYAHDIIGDLNSGAIGWIDWNLLLEKEGGPNHVGNVCDAAVVADCKKQELNRHAQYYFIGHFSKFFSPGSKHVKTTVDAKGEKFKRSKPPGPYGTCTGETGLEATSVIRPDRQIATVVLNCAAEEIQFKLKIGNSAVALSAPARSITTYVLPDMNGPTQLVN